MKAWIYTDDEIARVSGFTQEKIDHARTRITPTIERAIHPSEAEFFWIPIDLGHWEAYHGGACAIHDGLPRLSHWRGNESRHVAYFCSDGAEPTGLPLIMFRQSFYKDRRDPNVVAWPYAVDDFGDLVTDDFSSLKYDISFVGNRLSNKSRAESFDSVANAPELSSYLDDSKLHWGSVENTPIGKQRKELFRWSMQNSAMVLSARGGGLSCYRFFEAMSAGRIPVLFADDWELPHQNLIDWNKCIVQIPESQAKDAGKILMRFLDEHDDGQLVTMGREARMAWWKHLSPHVWPCMMDKCIMEKLT